ncbi:hypothetical protein, partial [Photorhabdus sp. RM157S]|uniref:hypothetical protein n=1 Tax=Photorhabdus sp. RM157S TaxID=3342827 RepID=UPI0036D99FF1
AAGGCCTGAGGFTPATGTAPDRLHAAQCLCDAGGFPVDPERQARSQGVACSRSVGHCVTGLCACAG